MTSENTTCCSHHRDGSPDHVSTWPSSGKESQVVSLQSGVRACCPMSHIPLGVKSLNSCFCLYSVDGIGNVIGICNCVGSLQREIYIKQSRYTMPSMVLTWQKLTNSPGSSALLHASIQDYSHQPPQLLRFMHTPLAPPINADHTNLVYRGPLFLFFWSMCVCVCVYLLHLPPIKLCLPINERWWDHSAPQTICHYQQVGRNLTSGICVFRLLGDSGTCKLGQILVMCSPENLYFFFQDILFSPSITDLIHTI